VSNAVHGGRVLLVAQERNERPELFLDFSVNLNPLGPPAATLDFIQACACYVQHYPDPYSSGLASALAEHLGVPAGFVLPAAGTTPILYRIPRAVGPRLAVVIGPAFAEYAEGLAASGFGCRYVHAAESDGFLVTAEVVRRALDMGPDLVYVANPANPTGRLVPDGSMDLLVEAANAPSGPHVVVDEAFIEFCPARTLAGAVRAGGRLIVLRSMTKIYNVPGLRLGYAVAPPALVDRINAMTEPWSVSTVAQLAGRFLIQDTAHVERTKAATKSLREALAADLGGFRQYPSDANFILLGFADRSPEWFGGLIRFCGDERIIVRNAGNMAGLEPGYLRVAVKASEDNRRLAEVLKAYLLARPGGPGEALSVRGAP
jgi:threonine-phosphate decarboxylase